MAAETSPYLHEAAPAKINLTLHVLGRREDGYHALESLVTFADVSDVLELRPSADLSLEVFGPTGPASGPAEQNIVLKAARALSQRVEGLALGAFRLTKHLPAAAGIGGGSADAAAALRLLARLNGIAVDDPRLNEAARATGADVPVCLAGGARMMSGAGETLGPPLALPPLHAILVNPGVAVETPAVFRALALEPGATKAGAPHPAIGPAPAADHLLAALGAARNDLEPVAIGLEPIIGDALDQLRRLDGCRLARMSGSGATCFGLFEGAAPLIAGVGALRRRRPGWWVHPAMLGNQ